MEFYEHVKILIIITTTTGVHAVAQLVEALRYKPEDRGIDSRWCHWNFSLT
jgi:acyl-ACP thioesterase